MPIFVGSAKCTSIKEWSFPLTKWNGLHVHDHLEDHVVHSTALTHPSLPHRYTNTLLKRVAAGGVCYSKSRKCFVSRSTLLFKAEEYTDMRGMCVCVCVCVHSHLTTHTFLHILIPHTLPLASSPLTSSPLTPSLLTELQALAETIGPYGIRFLGEKLMDQVSGQV